MADLFNDSAIESQSDFQKIKRLEALMFAVRMNQRQFCAATGITTTHWNQIIKGKRGVSVSVITKIKETFPNVNEYYLISGEGSMFTDTPPAAEQPPECERLRSENEYLKDQLIKVQAELVEAQRVIIRMQPMIADAAHA